MRASLSSLVVLASSLMVVACGDPEKKRIGSTCTESSECADGLCAEGVCVDPSADDDGDGIINALEVSLGSSPSHPDTDEDGIADGDEVTDDRVNVDTDGDGLADIVESASKDPDSDCIPDQYDAENNVATSDLSPMIDVVCSFDGVCAGQRDAMRVVCPDQVTAVCVYDDVPGWADPEAACDARDEDCDGAADDGFPDRDADAIADCVDSDWDNDAVADGTDNCPLAANPDQADGDSDGVGDACVASYELTFVAAPIQATSGVTFAAAVGLVARGDDAPAEAPVPPFRGAVALTLDAAGSGATLGGTMTRTAGDDGVARFDDLVIDGVGAGMALTASSGALGPATTPTFEVRSGALASFRIDGIPAEVTAGASTPLTIVALDANGHAILDYDGTVVITATDPEAVADATPLGDAGLVTTLGAAPEAITFFAAGDQTLTVTEVDGTATGSATTAVVDAGFAALDVVAPATAVAGEALTVGVTARDAFGNVAVTYAGSVALSADDAAATLPAAIDFGTLGADKAWSGELTLRTAGARTVTARDASAAIDGEAAVTVAHAAASRLALVPSAASVGAGSSLDLEVTAYDPFDNVATGFVGSVVLASSDAAAALPGAHDFAAADAGRFTFTGVVLATAGPQTITATGPDGVTGAAEVTVAAGAVATLDIVTAPTSVVAGAPFTVSFTLRDAQGNLVPDAARSVRVDYGDGTSETLGITTAAATLDGLTVTTAGSQSVTLTLLGVGVVDAVTVVVVPAAASRLDVAAPASVVAGAPHDVALTVYDAFDNVATGYRGTVVFTTSDTAGTAPTAFTFTASEAGAKVVSGFIGRTAGTATLTASDAASALTGSDTLAYTPAAATRLAVTGLPATTVAGTTLGFTLTAYDAYDNIATGYRGSVQVSASDAAATLPGGVTFTAADAGVHTFAGLVLTTAGDHVVTVADPNDGALVAAVPLVVTPAAATRLEVALGQASVAAGVTTSVVVTARDAFGNVASGYLGTVALTSSDASATLPPNFTFTADDRGVRTLGGLVFRTVGSQALIATDVVTASITGNDIIVVSEGADIVYLLQGVPASTSAGATFSLTLRVEDTFGNVISGYAGRVVFDSDDLAADLPADYQFAGTEGGTRTFTGLALKTAGARRVTATDADDVRVSASAIVDVVPGSAATLDLACNPTTLAAGAASSCTVSALDSFGNAASGYRGTVAFSSTDPAATLPGATAFTAADAGVRTFPGVVLVTAGARTVTVGDGTRTDVASYTVSPAAPSALQLTAATGNVVAGASFDLTVTAVDAYGNTATSYTGTVGFAVDAGQATLPNAYTFVAGDQGRRTFTAGFALNRAGTRTITATGTALPNTTAQATRVVTHAAPASIALTPASGAIVAGVGFDLQAEVRDAFANVATGYRGTVRFAVDAGVATLPANYTFTAADAGVHAFTGAAQLRLELAGSRTITATDTVTAAVTGQATRTVTAAAATRLVVALPGGAVVAGTPFDVTITARDAFDNVATGYTGTVAFTSSDVRTGNAKPANYTFTSGAGRDNGVHVFTGGVTFVTVGSQTLTATDTVTASVTGSAARSVTHAPANKIAVAIPGGTVVAGTPFSATVTVQDTFGNTATGYTGTVRFTSTDARPGAAVPADYTFTSGTGLDNGVRTFTNGVTLVTTGAQTITVRDSVTPSINGTASRTVTPAAAARLAITGLATTATAGQSLGLTVTAFDAYDNIATGYTGRVEVDATGDGAAPPLAHTYVAGDAGAFAFTGLVLQVVGDQTVTARDSASATPASDSEVVRVNPGAATRLDVNLTDATVPAGATTTATVTARDAFDNVATGYTGTARFTSSDGNATLPANYIFKAADAGVKSFGGIIYRTVGGQTLVATDTVTATITGSDTIDVQQGADKVYEFVGAPTTIAAGTPFGFTLRVEDAFGNLVTNYTGRVKFSSDDPIAVLPADYTFTVGDGGQHAFTGVALKTAGTQRVIATDTADATITGSTPVDVTPLAMSTLELACTPTSLVAGGATSCTLRAVDAHGNTATGYRGAVTFTSPGDAQSTLPSPNPYTFTAADSGFHSFAGIVLKTAGAPLVQVADGAVTDSVTFDVTAAAASAIQLTAATGNVTAGAPFTLTVTARDAYNNVARSYRGTVSFAVDAGGATLPAAYAFTAGDNGVRAFTDGFALERSGARTITATGTALATPTATATRSVKWAAAHHIALTPGSGTSTAGVGFDLRAEVQDAYDNIVEDYTGTVRVSVDAGNGTLGATALPATYTYTVGDAGVRNFNAANGQVALRRAGARVVTVRDTVASTVVGTAARTINPAAASKIAVAFSVPGSVEADTKLTIDTTIQDAFDNTVTGFAGTIRFSVPNGVQAVLPADYLFVPASDQGKHTFTNGVQLRTVGTQTVTVTQTPGTITGGASMVILPGPTARLQVDAAPATVVAGDKALTLTVTAQDAWGNTTPAYNGKIHFAPDAGSATLPGDYTFVPATDAGVHTFASPKSALDLAGARTINAFDTTTPGITDATPAAVQVDPACIGAFAPATLEWKTQPVNGRVNETLAASEVQLKDGAGNVCTNLDGRVVGVRIGVNPGMGVLSGTASVATVDGIAKFDTLRISGRGNGYTLIASSGALTPVASSAFDLTWSQPTFVGTPVVTSTGGCTTVDYTVAQAGSGPVTLAVTYDAGAAGQGPATPLGTVLGDADGLVALATTPAGAAHRFVWDNFADLGAADVGGLKLNLAATVPGGTAVNTSLTFDVAAAWSGAFRETQYTAAVTPGKPAIGDLDQDGVLDMVVPDPASTGRFIVLWGETEAKLLESTSPSSTYLDGATGRHQHAAVGDVDRDGDLDLVFADTNGASGAYVPVTIKGPRELTLGAVTALAPCADGAVSDLLSGDINANGVVDFAFACVANTTQGAGPGVRVMGFNVDSVFTQIAVLATTVAPRALAAAHMDGDGYPDLVMGFDNSVKTSRADGNGNLLLDDSRAATNVSDIAVGDLDRDGFVDVAYTSKTAGNVPNANVIVYFAKGAGDLEGASVTYTLPNEVDSVEIGDVDHDGRPDVVLGSTTKDEVTLLRSAKFRTAGDPSEARTTWDTGGGTGPNRVFVADVSNDRRNDIAFTRGASGAGRSAGYIAGSKTRWCEPRWTAPRTAPTVDVDPRSQQLVDVNRDGKLDLVQMPASEQVFISYGRGDGTFETAPDVIALGNDGQTTELPAHVVFGDFEGNDGDLDAMIMLDPVTATEGDVRLYRQVSAYNWKQNPNQGTGRGGLVAGDFDLDGDMDVARLRYDGAKSTIVVRTQTTPGAFVDLATVDLGKQAIGLAAHDLNLDGIRDFVVKMAGSTADLCTIVSTSSAPATWPTTIPSGFCITSSAATLTGATLSDVTNDERPELVYAVSRVLTLRTFSTATGKFNTVETYTLCDGLNDIEVADFDGVNGPDVALQCNTSSTQPAVHVYPQTTSGVGARFNALGFVSFGRVESEGNFQAIAAGDLDGGRPDIALHHLAFHNRATALAFEQPAGLSMTAGAYPSETVAVDMDPDGYPDLVSFWSSSNGFTVARQTPAGAFNSTETTTTGLVYALAVGHFTGDTRPDVAVATTISGPTVINAVVTYARAPAGGALVATGSITLPARATRLGTATLTYTSSSNVVSRDPYEDITIIAPTTQAPIRDRLYVARQDPANQFTLFSESTALPFTTIDAFEPVRLRASRLRVLAVGGAQAGVPTIRLVALKQAVGGGNTFELLAGVTLSATYATSGVTLVGLDTGDIDRDGDDDIIVAYERGTSGTELVGYLQQADGTFTETPTDEFVTQGFVTKLTLADIDQDGRLDTVLEVDDLGYTTHVEVVYQDAAIATLAYRPDHSFVASGRETGLGLPIDMDRNGRPDFVTVDINGRVTHILPAR